MSAAPATSPMRRDLWITVLALALLVAWDASGLDRVVSAWAGGHAGFPWRDAWVTRHLLHDGGRVAAWAVFGALVLDALAGDRLFRRTRPTLGSGARWAAIGVVLANLVVVPTLKRTSATSCPWDLAEFGGVARYVPHWDWGVPDGGPGHCFPSGHAVAAFAFFALYFAWRELRPEVARRWLVATLVAGLAFGTAQVLRGAHFVSHVGWSAFACWTLAAAFDALSRRRRRSRVRPAAAAGSPASPRRS